MEFGFGLGIAVTCVKCGAECDFPERANRVLEGDVLYADVDARCESCGSQRVRIDVSIGGDVS